MSNPLKQASCQRRVPFPGQVAGSVWEKISHHVPHQGGHHVAHHVQEMVKPHSERLPSLVSSEDLFLPPGTEDREDRNSSKFDEEFKPPPGLRIGGERVSKYDDDEERRHSYDPNLHMKVGLQHDPRPRFARGSKPISREKLKVILAADKERLKRLVMKKFNKQGLQELLRKKRVLESGCEVKRSLRVYEDGPRSSTESLMTYLHNESSNEGYAGLTEDFVHENLYIELGKIVLTAVQADRVSVYLTNIGESILSRRAYTWKKTFNTPTSSHSQDISSVAKHVARTHEGLLVKDLTQDKRFNNFSVLEDEISLICIPIIAINRDMVGVIELTRGLERPPFTEKNYQVAEGYIAWACLGIQQVVINEAHKRKKNLSSFLVDVTNDMFHDVRQYQDVIVRIMNHTKTLVAAERCMIILYDQIMNELYVEVIDNGTPVYEVPKKPYRIPIDQNSVSGRVAMSKRLSIHNKIKESDREYYCNIEKLCNITVRNSVCIPVMNGDCFLGVFHAINKRGGTPFRNGDIEVLKMFSMYFSWALNYSKVYADMQFKENRAFVAIEQLQEHALIQKSSDLDDFVGSSTSYPDNFLSHLFVITDPVRKYLPRLFVNMVRESFGNVFDVTKLCFFTEAVCKNYRNIPYHNWEHAFLVSHCMYIILKDPFMKEYLTEFEMIGLMIACICHDLDHRGYNNTFFETLNLPLAALYSTSVMEQHHFQMTVLILQQEPNNIFAHLTGEEYKEMLELLRHAIISTDLAMFFGNNKPRLEGLLNSGAFDITNPEHKEVMKAVLMTGCDLCAAAKPWAHQVKNVKLLYDEFYIQGDIERERGFEPIAMMDRENKEKLVEQQSGFMKFVVLPLYHTLGQIIPIVQDIEKTVHENVDNWFRIGSGEVIDPWQPSLPSTIGVNSEWSRLNKIHSVESLLSSNDVVSSSQARGSSIV